MPGKAVFGKETPVYAGLFDVNGCMLGSGITGPGSLSVIAGTWGIHAAVTKSPLFSREITQTCCFADLAHAMCVDSAATSCANLNWFLKKERKNLNSWQIDELMKQTECDPNLYFLPYCYQPMDLPAAEAKKSSKDRWEQGKEK